MYRLMNASSFEGARRQCEEPMNSGTSGATDKPIEITMVASEMFPFAKSGGLGDVIGALPLALGRMGHKVCVYLPAYRSVVRKYAPGSPVRIPGVFSDARYEVFSLEHEGVSVRLVGADDLFDRAGFYGDARGAFPDNAERFARFARGALSHMESERAHPSIIHCHDWQSALIPPLLKYHRAGDAKWSGVSTVFTIHNLAYQGRFHPDDFAHTRLPDEAMGLDGLEFHGDLNFMKGGILFSDVFSTVSERYAQEMLTEEQGEGLEGVVVFRKDALFGIMNGIDDAVWNPESDPHIPARFSSAHPEAKAACKAALQKELGLEPDAEGPLCVVVSRLAHQKGIDLILETMDELMGLGVSLAILGTGEEALEEGLAEAASVHRGRVAFVPAYDEALSHRMYAGGDVLLMPSRYEPSGLNQLYAMRYGALPYVRRVGGLADSVASSPTPDPDADTGFHFDAFDPAGFLAGVERICRVFLDQGLWRMMMRNAMEKDSGWDGVAPRYVELYEKAMRPQAR